MHNIYLGNPTMKILEKNARERRQRKRKNTDISKTKRRKRVKNQEKITYKGDKLSLKEKEGFLAWMSDKRSSQLTTRGRTVTDLPNFLEEDEEDEEMRRHRSRRIDISSFDFNSILENEEEDKIDEIEGFKVIGETKKKENNFKKKAEGSQISSNLEESIFLQDNANSTNAESNLTKVSQTNSSKLFDSNMFKSAALNFGKKSVQEPESGLNPVKNFKNFDRDEQLLESSFKKINQFEEDINGYTESKLEQNIEDILERIKEDDDVVVPLHMSKMKREIRTKKKDKITNLLFEKKNEKYKKRFGKLLTISEKDFKKGIDKEIEKSSESELRSMMKKISIESSIIKSIVGSRFSKIVQKKKLFSKARNNFLNKKPKKKTSMMEIFKIYSNHMEEKIEEINQKTFNEKISPILKFSPLEDAAKKAEVDVNPFYFKNRNKLNQAIKEMLPLKESHFAQFNYTYISCIAHSKNFVLVGTVKGEILEFSISDLELENSQTEEKRSFGFFSRSSKNQKKGKIYQIEGVVESISISPLEEIWAAGSSNGDLLIRKMGGGWAKKHVKNFSFQQNPIILLKFIQESLLILSTANSIWKIHVKDQKIRFDLRSDLMFQNLKKVVKIHNIDEEGINILAVSTLTAIYFCLVTLEDFRLLFKLDKPKFIPDGTYPSFCCTTPPGSSHNLIIVFWDTYIFFIKKENKGKFFNLGYKKSLYSVVWSCFLKHKAVCIIDEEFNIRIEMIETLMHNRIKISKENEKIKETEKKVKIQFNKQRSIRLSGIDDSRALNFHGKVEISDEKNTPSSYLVEEKEEGKEMRIIQEQAQVLPHQNGIVFITTNSDIFEVELFPVTIYIQYLIEKKNYVKAFDVMVLSVQKKLFASPKEILEIRQTAVTYILTYLQEKLSFIPSKNESHLSQFSNPEVDEGRTMKVMLIAIDTLIKLNQEKLVFSLVLNKFLNKGYTEEFFFRIISKFISTNLIKRIPLKTLANCFRSEGVTDANLALLLQIERDDLEKYKQDFDFVYGLLKKSEENNFVAMLKLSLLFPEKLLPKLLNELLRRADMIEYNEKLNITIKILDGDLEKYDKENLEKDKNFLNYFKIYWVLWMILSWHEKWLTELGNKESKNMLFMIAIEWMLLQQNFKRLIENNAQLFFELFYQIFLEYFNLTFQETKKFFHLLWKKQKNILIERKKKEAAPINSALNPRVSYLAKMANNEKEEPLLPEYMSKDGNSTFKNILLSIQCMVPGKYQIDFSYLFVKILNLSSMYKSLLQEKQWIKKMISKLVSTRLRENRFWLYFKPLNKHDFEIEILRILNSLELGVDYLKILADRTEMNGFLQVSAGIIDKLYGPFHALKVYYKAFSRNQNDYIFTYTIEKLAEFKEEEEHITKEKLETPNVSFNTSKISNSSSTKGKNLIPMLTTHSVLNPQIQESTLRRGSVGIARLNLGPPTESKNFVVNNSNYFKETFTDSNLSLGDSSGFEFKRVLSNEEKSDMNLRYIQKVRTQMVEFLTENLEELIQFSKEKSHELILELPLKSLRILKKLDSFPELQIEYYELMLKEDEETGKGRLDLQTKLRYIELKCEYDPDMVTDCIESFGLPLDESLKICQKYKNHFAIAYIKFRLGMKIQAIEEYLKIINLSEREYLTKNVEDKYKYISDAEYAFQQIMRLGVEYIKNNYKKGKILFRKVIRFIVGGLLILKKPSKGNVSLEHRAKISELVKYIEENFVKELLIKMSVFLNEEMKIILGNVKLTGSLRLSVSREMLIHITNEIRSMEETDLIILWDKRIEKNQLIVGKWLGKSSVRRCFVCSKTIYQSNEDALLLSCYHVLHLNCAKQLGKKPKDIQCWNCRKEKAESRIAMAKLQNVKQDINLSSINSYEGMLKGVRSFDTKLADMTENIEDWGLDVEMEADEYEGFAICEDMEDEKNARLHQELSQLGLNIF